MKPTDAPLQFVGVLLQPVVEALDSLDIAICLFDDEDRLMAWNRSFVAFFPEHAGAVAVGEPYAVNLRRFYNGRLSAEEMPQIDRYIEEGVARHRAQQRPFAFEHRGRRLMVASLPVPGIGRIRIWRRDEYGSPTDDAASFALERLNLQGVEGTSLFDHVADGVMVSGADDRILWVNQPFATMYGFSHRDTAVGMIFEEAYRRAWRGFENSASALFESGLTVLKENMRFAGAPFEVPLPFERWSRVIEQRGPDGKRFFAHVDITILKRQQNRLQIAERRARESEALLRQKSALLETTLERMEQGIMMVSAEGIVEVCNDRVLQLLDLPRELMASRPPFWQVVEYQWTHGEFARTAEDLLPMMRPNSGIEGIQRYDRERPDGRVIEVSIVPIEGGGVVRTYTDITDRKRSEERIRHLASHDGLTSLINREVFLEYLAGATESASSTGEGFAVHYIDIDEFKPVNDRFGHAIGDKVLALAAGKMSLAVGKAGVVGRMGGDEFAILQYRVSSQGLALEMGRRVLLALREPLEVEAHLLQLDASLGIAIYPDAGIDADVLIRHADAAMYAAKHDRRADASGIQVFGTPD
ncbi:MAG: hypothetical protein JWQ41_1332 [Variovorax sp.]|nr:hypothetical protein [Variovorax sp.]